MFNVLKSKLVSPGEIRPVSLDSVPKEREHEKAAVFHKSWDQVCQSSEQGIKDKQDERKKAITIIEEAQAKAQLIQRKAYEKAFFLGKKAGLEVAERRFRSALQALEKAHGEFNKLKENLVLGSERELIALCLAISRKVLSQEVTQNKDVLLNLIRCGLRYVLDKDHVRIRVNPSTSQCLKQFECDITSSSEGFRDVVFEEDERIARGDVLIETRFGNVDCGIGSQLAEIEKCFQQVLAEKGTAIFPDGNNQ